MHRLTHSLTDRPTQKQNASWTDKIELQLRQALSGKMKEERRSQCGCERITWDG